MIQLVWLVKWVEWVLNMQECRPKYESRKKGHLVQHKNC